MQESARAPQVVQIELLGVSFSIRTDESPDYIRSLVAELKERYARLTAGGKVVAQSPNDVALGTHPVIKLMSETLLHARVVIEIRGGWVGGQCHQ